MRSIGHDTQLRFLLPHHDRKGRIKAEPCTALADALEQILPMLDDKPKAGSRRQR